MKSRDFRYLALCLAVISFPVAAEAAPKKDPAQDRKQDNPFESKIKETKSGGRTWVCMLNYGGGMHCTIVDDGDYFNDDQVTA